jgi:hypothetical protein
MEITGPSLASTLRWNCQFRQVTTRPLVVKLGPSGATIRIGLVLGRKGPTASGLKSDFPGIGTTPLSMTSIIDLWFMSKTTVTPSIGRAQ